MANVFGGSNISLFTFELEVVARPTDGIFIPFLALFGGIYYMILGKKYFNRNYLISIIGLTLFSIFITATRSWLISSLFIFGSYYIFISRKKITILKRFAIPIVAALFLIPFVPIIYQQIDLAFQRYETVGLLLQGDLTAGGTLKRLDERAPRVMAKFYESPIFGWGFGDEGNKYTDEHVGNQNLLMQCGIIGFIFWFLLWANFIVKMQRLNKLITTSNPYKNIPQIFILMLIGILFIHSSAQWFDYLLQFLPGFTIIFLLTFASFVNKKALEEEKLLRNFKIDNLG
ncbi:MAG: hypothetical protein IPJ03_00070 [Ignavibacteriales bacterium]|nr:hypothetical protein [Ignavibacteriales bacterium]